MLLSPPPPKKKELLTRKIIRLRRVRRGRLKNSGRIRVLKFDIEFDTDNRGFLSKMYLPKFNVTYVKKNNEAEA